MTKRRPPLSTGDALSQVIAQVGSIKDVAAIVKRSATTVYAWGNPDTDDAIPQPCAILLDAAFQEAGGVGAPFHELHTLQLDLAGAGRFANQLELGRLAAEVIRENGDAEEAIVLALLPDATDAHRRATLEEIEQAMAKLQRAHGVVRAIRELHQTGPPTA